MSLNIRRLLPCCLMISALSLFAGCCNVHYIQHEHPLQDKAVKTTGVSGRTITLADGRKFEIAGVSLEGLSQQKVNEFEQRVKFVLKWGRWRNSPADPGEKPKKRTKPFLVPFRTKENRAIFVVITDSYPVRMDRLPSIQLFPSITHEYPRVFDLGHNLIEDGYALANPAELPPNVAMTDEIPERIGKVPLFRYYSNQSFVERYTQAELSAISRNIKIHYDEAVALQNALKWGNKRKQIAELLASGADINSVHDGKTLLIILTKNHDIEMIAWLIDHGADPNVKVNGQSAFTMAWRRGEIEILKLYLQHGCRLESLGKPKMLMKQACNTRGANTSKVKFLLEQGVRPENAAMASLAISGNIDSYNFDDWKDVVALLIQQGYDLNTPSSEGYLPLHSAIRAKTKKAVKYLIEHGAKPELLEPKTKLNAYGVARSRIRNPKMKAEIIKLLNCNVKP